MATTIKIDIEKFPATSTALALGCSVKHLKNLHDRGELTQTGRGKYNLTEAIKVVAKGGNAKLTELQKATLEVNTQKARKGKLENDTTEKLLIPVEEVKEFAMVYAGVFTMALESHKKKIGSLLDNETRKKFYKAHGQIRKQIEDELEVFKLHCTEPDSTTTE